MNSMSTRIDGGSEPVPAENQGSVADTCESGQTSRRELTALLLDEIADAADVAKRARLQQQVVVLNMPVATSIARSYANRGIAVDDLEQVAYVGLVEAVQRFDPSFDRDLLSYAVAIITGEVKRHFRDRGWMVRPPRRIQELQGHVRRALSDLAQTMGRTPKPSEVAHRLGVEVESVIEALAVDGAFSPTSLDAPIGSHRPAPSRGELSLVGENDRDFASAEARAVLGPVVRTLAPRDRRILQLRFFAGWTQQQIADEIGVTQMQVSRQLTRIFADLRANLT